MRYLIGVDEAGRAPLAGPVAVGAVMVRSGFDWSRFDGVRDSKKMTALARERTLSRMRALREEGELSFAVAYASHELIDLLGITKAVHHAVAQALRKLRAEPLESSVYLDGLLHAPAEFKYQQTLIGGDDVLPVISLAAVAAKVSRDRLMQRLAKRYPVYSFEVHKGYPTKRHYAAIEAHGLCDIHRRSYCRNLLLTEKSV